MKIWILGTSSHPSRRVALQQCVCSWRPAITCLCSLWALPIAFILPVSVQQQTQNAQEVLRVRTLTPHASLPAYLYGQAAFGWTFIGWCFLYTAQEVDLSQLSSFLIKHVFFGKLDWRSCSADEELWHAKPVNGLPHSDICIISVQTILTQYLIYDLVYGRWVNMRSCQCMNDRIGPKKVENEKTVELRSFIAASSNIGSIDFFLSKNLVIQIIFTCRLLQKRTGNIGIETYMVIQIIFTCRLPPEKD